jgi:hypothetical protein
MYNLEIIDLNDDTKKLVTATGAELNAQYSGLIVGQMVRDWQMYVVTPLVG